MKTAAIRRFAVPSPEELIDRARAMMPEIRALAEETERNRNVLPHIIDKIREAELLRTCRPKEFGGFAPTGTAVAVDGGYVLNGSWSFASGCDHASWAYLGAFIMSPDAKPSSEGAFFLLPIGDCEIVDNWFVSGLAGTGSKDIVVSDVFVPAHR